MGTVGGCKMKWSERQDLNLRRLAPKASALARLGYAPSTRYLLMNFLRRNSNLTLKKTICKSPSEFAKCRFHLLYEKIRICCYFPVGHRAHRWLQKVV